MVFVLFGEVPLGGGDAPVDAKGWVIEAHAALGGGIVEVVALVGEDGFLRENGEAVGEAARYE